VLNKTNNTVAVKHPQEIKHTNDKKSDREVALFDYYNAFKLILCALCFIRE